MPEQNGWDDDSRPGPADVRVADFDDLAAPGTPDDPDGSGVRRVVFGDEPHDDTTAHPAGRLQDRSDPAPLRTVDLDAEPGPEDRPAGGGAPRVASLGARSLDGGDDRRGAGRPGTRRGARAGRAGSGPDRSGPGELGPEGTGPDEDDASGSGRAAAGRTRRGRRGPASGARGGRDAATPPGPPQDDESRAREICLRLLTDRPRTVKELADALRRKEIPDDVAAKVLERFDEVGLVDDEAFAGQWVRSRHRHKGLGRRALAAELHRKGVGKEVADTALDEIDAESEANRARELVDHRLRTMPVGTKDERMSTARRLVGMLARKGYGAGTAYSVVREAITARGAEEDELGEGPAEG